MTGRYGSLDYPTLTKRALAACVAVLLASLTVEAVVATTAVTIPDWEHALLADVELLAVVSMFLSVFVFGVALPLTE